jgi:hypothetical protein
MIYEDKRFAPITNQEPPEGPAEDPETEGDDEESEGGPLE